MLEVKIKKQVEARIVYKDSNEEKKLFYAVVLEPMTDVTPEGDSHGHVMKADEIENSAHYYMEMGSTVFVDHQKKISAKVVESYISPINFTPEGSDSEITKGSWIMAVKILDEEIWKKVKSGEITAFSPGGYGELVDID